MWRCKSFNSISNLLEIAGVRTPTVIAMPVPNKTTRSRTVFDFLYLSINLLNGETGAFLFEEWPALWYVETSSSDACWLGSKQNFARLQSNEYKATIPPAKQITQQQYHHHHISAKPTKTHKKKRGGIKLLPSPLSFALNMKTTYLNKEKRVKVQKIKEKAPKTASSSFW